MIPREVRVALGRRLSKLGFIADEYVSPERTATTNEPCPVCGKSLAVRQEGNSYEIICPDHGALVSARGV